ncbi:hypothetical protein LZ30DRAFT_579176, partial [Colletotrichum cereale]
LIRTMPRRLTWSETPTASGWEEMRDEVPAERALQWPGPALVEPARYASKMPISRAKGQGRL